MCPMADIYELRDHPQKGKLEERAIGNLLKEESIGTTENVCRNEVSILDTRREIEIEAILARVATLHTKKESIILEAEEDPRKPWYFTRV